MQPSYQGIRSTFKNNASNEDIRQAIVVAVPKATQQMKDAAKQFKGDTEKETCENIFNYLLHNIRYKADGENQIIRFPSALMHTKTGDCKSYSLFTAAVLNNLNIPCHFVLQSFGPDPTPSHIYCATNSGILIDAVYKKFNQEKKPTFKYIIPINMKVTHMAGIANNPNTQMDGLGDWVKKNVTDPVKQAANYVKETVEDANLKKYTLAIPRQVFLGLFSLNVDGMASKVQKQGTQARWERKWISYGGDAQALSRAIRDGAGRAEKNLGFLSKIKQWIDSRVKINGIGATADQNAKVKQQLGDGGALKPAWETLIYGLSTGLGASVGALVTGGPGAAVGGPAGALIGDMVISNTDSIVDMLYPVEPGADVTKNADSPAVGKGGNSFTPNWAKPAIDEVKKQAETKGNAMMQENAKKARNTALMIGGGVIIAGAIYMATKKSKSKK